MVLHEAGPQLGGRATSGDGPYGVNLGPHVVYEGGAVMAFLRQRRLHRELRLRRNTGRGIRVVDDRRRPPRRRRPRRPYVAMHLKREAPADVDFATWATESFGRRIGTHLRHLSGLYTFHHDPGSLSAESVWDGCRRSMARPDRLRYIGGGWSSLIATLEAAARARGVRIELDSPIDELPVGSGRSWPCPHRRPARCSTTTSTGPWPAPRSSTSPSTAPRTSGRSPST